LISTDYFREQTYGLDEIGVANGLFQVREHLANCLLTAFFCIPKPLRENLPSICQAFLHGIVLIPWRLREVRCALTLRFFVIDMVCCIATPDFALTSRFEIIQCDAFLVVLSPMGLAVTHDAGHT
jgi:hypothetical protein